MPLRGLLLLERSNPTDPRSSYVLAPADILPDSGLQGAKKAFGLLVGVFAGAFYERLRSHGRIGHQYRHDVRRQGCCYRIHPLTTYLCLQSLKTAPLTAKKESTRWVGH